MCRYRLLDVIVSGNGTQVSTVVTDFYKDLGMQTKSLFVVHPKANGQVQSTNKVLLKGLEKKLDGTIGLWAELLHEILWSYHTTP